MQSPRRTRTLIAGLFTFVLVGAGGHWVLRNARIGRARQDVRRSIAARRFDEASRSLDRWLSFAPLSAEAHYLRAQIAWSQDDLPTAEDELFRARELGHDPHAIERLHGLLLARSNQKTEAELVLRHYLAESTEIDPEVAETLAKLYLGSYQLGEAAAVLDRWMRERPGDARPVLMQTDIDIRGNAGPEVIIGRFKEAVARDPHLEKARLGLATQLRLNHRHSEAASEYAAYLASKPDDPLGYLARA